jgi:hypothetical protein
MDASDELKQHEETKRQRHESPLTRYRALLAMIEWAEQQLPPEKRTPAARLEEERRKLADLAAWQAAQPQKS